MEHVPFVREQRANATEIAGRIPAIISGLHPVVVAHDPNSNDTTILRKK
jgi:hypothetical protein